MSRLASIYSGQGRYDESIKLYQECLQRMKFIQGENHPDTLKVMHNLGCTHSDMGQLSKAAALFKDCYEKRLVVLGRDHADTLTTMSHLA